MPPVIVTIFDTLLQSLSVAFHAPSAINFQTLVYGLVLCLGRPTVTNLWRASSQRTTKHPCALHRFFSRAVWSPERLSELLLTKILIPYLVPTGTLHVAGDDTTCGKSGRRVAYASWFRDAVASTGGQTVKHWAHNWVILCLIVRCPWAKNRLWHIPFMARLYRAEKDCRGQRRFRTRQQIMNEMVGKVRQWEGSRRIELGADGAYATHEMVEGLAPGVVLISRVRRYGCVI